MLKQKLDKFIIVILAASFPLTSIAQADPNFNPNKLIEDKIFEDTQTFGGAEGIQKFLEVKNSILANTGPSFLAMLKEPDAILLKQGLEDPRPNLGRMRTAAELIWDASRQSGLNPQVVIVTLQKEQGLITNHQDTPLDKLQKVLDKAMGFDCPDSGGCGDLFPGFYFQLFGNFDSAGNRYLGAAKSLMKSYSYAEGRGPLLDGLPSKVGQTIVLENTPSGAYNPPSNQAVTLLNRATAALYRYTPHVFNGNYNFWKYFQEWFRYPNGTILKLASGVDLYIIQNGTKQLVPAFVAIARALNTANPVIISPTEFDSYPTDKVFGPTDGTVVRVVGENKQFVFLNNTRHPASDFVIGQRGLDVTKALSITAQEAALFEQGPVLPPSEGTVLKGSTDQSVYLVENSRLKLFSGFTFAQRKIPASKVITVPDAEVATYEKQGFVPPLDNTLIKSGDIGTIYLMEQGLKHPLSAELFKNRAFSFKQVVVLSKDEVSALAIGAFAHPKDRTWLKNSQSGELYLFKEGALHAISKYVAKQRGITPDYAFGAGEVQEWPIGIAIPPKDGTLVKGDKSATIYLVSKSQLRPITGKAFKRRGYSFKKVSGLPQEEVDAYAKGDVIVK
ncbi:MAG: hypothetical protein HYZ51_00645 [Candidatus Doudnabacteria bacterium]|nr:hypothetical protein [Candidatus Doudnabacteria bacterium]